MVYLEHSGPPYCLDAVRSTVEPSSKDHDLRDAIREGGAKLVVDEASSGDPGGPSTGAADVDQMTDYTIQTGDLRQPEEESERRTKEELRERVFEQTLVRPRRF